LQHSFDADRNKIGEPFWLLPCAATINDQSGSSYKKNPFVIKPKQPRDDLYYILAYVPDKAPNEFFILSQKEVAETTKVELKRLGRSQDYSMPSLPWSCVQPFKDKWRTLSS
jgi:hypothetical protein